VGGDVQKARRGDVRERRLARLASGEQRRIRKERTNRTRFLSCAGNRREVESREFRAARHDSALR
jgi:hypothetical protein